MKTILKKEGVNMNKLTIVTVGLGIVLGGLGMKSFYNTREFVGTQSYINTLGEQVQNVDYSNNEKAQFKVLNEQTNEYELLDDSQYRNYGSNRASCCPYINNENYKGTN